MQRTPKTEKEINGQFQMVQQSISSTTISNLFILFF